jgi:hypothetical protein
MHKPAQFVGVGWVKQAGDGGLANTFEAAGAHDLVEFNSLGFASGNASAENLVTFNSPKLTGPCVCCQYSCLI